MSRSQGNYYEQLAKEYLLEAGCQILATNYQALCGELDLIIQEGQTIAFVEVKFRKSKLFGGAASAVGKSKQIKIIKTAQHYLAKNKNYAKMPCRFDVLCIDGAHEIEWLQNAFITQTDF